MAPGQCREVFAAMQSVDPSLDGFALRSQSSYDSTNGHRYSLPTTSKSKPIARLKELKEHASKRLGDPH